jgi:predicted permease
MRFHLEMWAAEFRAQGLSDEDAQLRAEKRFGDSDEYLAYADRRAFSLARSERVRDWFVEWAQDVRFALRHFRKAPAFTTIAVLTLALGIGANTAIFSVVHRLLIDPLPYPNGDRIVALKSIGPSRFVSGLATTPPDAPDDPSPPLLEAWIGHGINSLEMMAGVEVRFLALLPNNEQDTVTHAVMTANLLSLLGAQPALGRSFRAEEEEPGADHVAMISHGWWQRAYAGRADVLGKTIQYEGTTYTVVGVMPRGFAIPMARPASFADLTMRAPDMWIPGRMRGAGMVYGRLKHGFSASDATREMQAIANTPEARGAGTPFARNAADSVRVRAMRAQDFLAPREVRAIQVLVAAVGALLLIACANVANLLLIRAWARRREFAVRIGLGAGRARLVRLALTESVLLALAAGALGVLIAWQALRAIIALRPSGLDSLANVAIEPAVLFWTAGISLLTGVLFGAAAAFVVSTQRMGDLLRSETRAASSGGVTRRIRATLIVTEIALSFALLVATGLLVRSFSALQDTRIGFDPHNLVAIDVLGPRIDRSPQAAQLREAVAAQLRATPGIVSAAMGSMPSAGIRDGSAIQLLGSAGTERVPIEQFQKAWVGDGYFDAARIPLVAGRLPRSLPGDAAPSMGFAAFSAEVVVSQSLARRIAADGNAIGRQIRPIGGPQAFQPPGMASATELPFATIVGIANDVHLPGPRADLETYQVYQMPTARVPFLGFIVRFASVPPDYESVLRSAIHLVEPTIIARRARLGDDYLREALAPTRFTLALLAAFALVALVLAVVGLYGSIAYTVTQRTREIGIRIALGATSNAVATLVLQDGLRLLGVGLVVGVATAAAAARALTALLYGVTSSDPATFAAIAGVVILISTLASLAPARRATRIDPVDALRAE